MIAAGSFDYALVRMQSRLGRRPSAADWRSLEHLRAFEAFLGRARECGFAEALQPLGTSANVHEIERSLREHWRACVAELARWVPEAWGRAVAWCAALADLPAFGHLAEGRERYAWMREDPALREVVSASESDGVPVRFSGPLAEATDARTLLRSWVAEWRARVPAGERPALEAFTKAVAEHVARFGHAHPHDAVALRRALEARLVAIVHGHLLEPVAAFAWLGVVALDLERLRGELVTRALVPEGVAP